jgi:outer membrane protein OmpA-like peptidoglycan-associated protein/flagellar hook assembly protein FlgD
MKSYLSSFRLFCGYLIISALITSCEQKKETNQLDLLMMIGIVQCDNRVCQSAPFQANQSMSIQTKSKSLIDFVLNDHLHVRVYENSQIVFTLDQITNRFNIQLKSGKLFVINQRDLLNTNDPFSLIISTPINKILVSKSYFSLEYQKPENTKNTKNTEKMVEKDILHIHDGDFKVKKDKDGYVVVNVKRPEEKKDSSQSQRDENTYEPTLVEIFKNKKIDKKKLSTIDTSHLKENIFTLLQEKKNQMSYYHKMERYSPNYDGRKDLFELNIAEKLSGKQTGWQLKFYDSQYRLQQQYFSPWTQKGNVELPKKLQWDMINSQGQILSDQYYIFHLNARDSNLSYIRLFEVDLIAPKGDIEVPNLSFSPNSDGVFDELLIKTNRLETGANWRMMIKDEAGKEIYTQVLKPKETEVKWNGKKSNGKPYKDGQYLLEVEGLDKALNQYLYSKEIFINQDEKYLIVDSSAKVFSPKGKDGYDLVRFTTKFTRTYAIDQWQFEIKKGNQLIKNWTGDQGPIPVLTWDGLNNQNQQVQDGKYEFVMKVQSGTNELISDMKTVYVDTTPPIVSIDFEGSSDDFTPDASGENDTLVIIPHIKEQSKIIGWTLNIYPKEIGQEKSSLLTINANQPPLEKITWHGQVSGRELESFEDYSLELSVTDEVKLTGSSGRIPFSTGAILIHDTRGDLIRISNILFKSGTTELVDEAKFQVVTHKLAKALLKNYKNSEISIEGHTDSQGEKTGFDNQKLSEDRANVVKDGIVAQGAKQSIKVRGHGVKYPLFEPELNKYQEQMNRRVDFLLKKNQSKGQKKKFDSEE